MKNHCRARKRWIIALALLMGLCATAYAATDYLAQYADRLSEAAVQAAAEEKPIAELPEKEEAAYRLGFAAGYDFAIRDWEEQEATLATRSLPESGEKTYVVNIHTDKFHNPDCASVPKIKEINKYVFVGARQQLIDLGFAPCQNCNP